jgi:hypothetical protein
MITIFKYLLPLSPVSTVDVPVGSRFLDVQSQDGDLVAWFLVDTDAPRAGRVFTVIGTGHPAGHVRADDHVATVQQGGYVWHCFLSPDGGL